MPKTATQVSVCLVCMDCLCLTSSFPLRTLSNILFVLPVICQAWYKSICYLFRFHYFSPNRKFYCKDLCKSTSTHPSMFVQVSKLKNGVRSCTARTRYIYLRDSNDAFVLYYVLPLLDASFSHLFDRSSQIFRKFVGKLKQRLNAAQVTTRWKESIGVNSVMP